MTPEEEALVRIDKLNVKRTDLPAVNHVDYSGRIQTVQEGMNPLDHHLFEAFEGRTGCPVVSTSFDVRSEPIVGSPDDTFHYFMGTDIERLIVGNAILHKESLGAALEENDEAKYERD